ncbi:ABC transporter ATP-binding protein [Bdellovibrio sp. BCCA]|uniref:ABC transporter ATP-binding protein n=1 Tax=Bdellovibrio sp. BCCA TaxID=3136281 RepID=UPI0030F2AC2C
MSSKILLDLKNISFSYPQHTVLQDISFQVAEGETLSLIGPSGCGKTTLLHLIAGDYAPSGGTIQKQGLWRRVHQSNALFPWLTVEENIRLGLRGIDSSRSLDFEKLVNLLDLKRVLNFYPRQLSGGLRQRSEIARALIGRPDGLLLDEPFSSLDYLIRRETREYMSELLKEFPIAVVLVTHDIPEALSLTQKIYIMNGRPATFQKSYESHQSKENLVEQIWQDLKFESEQVVEIEK